MWDRNNDEYETVIGLEVHVELSTATKIFCGCKTDFGAEPNTQCCPVCMGFPGALPTFNREVLTYGIRTALALHCTVEREPCFDRKNYFYPDLPKGYQISQLYRPIGRNGYLSVAVSGKERKIGIHELHMEEDAGKLIHSENKNETFIDFNRCGVPLLEIVSEPELFSAEETVAYLKKLRSVCTFLNISDCKMQEGSMRVDVNLSVRKKGEQTLGTRTETKNLNSFKAVEHAIAYERERQISLLSRGERVVQETRHFNDLKGEGYAMRSKEEAMDYRYFPEPDLPPMFLSEEEIRKERECLPESADERKNRFATKYCIKDQDASLLTEERSTAEIFEELLNAPGAAVTPGLAKETANFVIQTLPKLLPEQSRQKHQKLPMKNMKEILSAVEKKQINRAAGLTLFTALFSTRDPENFSVSRYIEEHSLSLVTDKALVTEAVKRVMEQNAGVVFEYQSGKEKVLGFLVGKAMKETKGRANPEEVRFALEEAMKRGRQE